MGVYHDSRCSKICEYRDNVLSLPPEINTKYGNNVNSTNTICRAGYRGHVATDGDYRHILYNRLKRHGLVRTLLFDCYDTLHAESIDGVVWNVQEALKNWDAKEGGGR